MPIVAHRILRIPTFMHVRLDLRSAMHDESGALSDYIVPRFSGLFHFFLLLFSNILASFFVLRNYWSDTMREPEDNLNKPDTIAASVCRSRATRS
jgi:hypothetical protein